MIACNDLDGLYTLIFLLGFLAAVVALLWIVAWWSR